MANGLLCIILYNNNIGDYIIQKSCIQDVTGIISWKIFKNMYPNRGCFFLTELDEDKTNVDRKQNYAYID